MGEKAFFEVSYTTETTMSIYIWYIVASWACEVTATLTQKRLFQCFFV